MRSAAAAFLTGFDTQGLCTSGNPEDRALYTADDTSA